MKGTMKTLSPCRRALGRPRPRWVGALALLTVFLVAPTHAYADSTYEPYSTWNGYKVYLSPANHGNSNIGCNGYNETLAARKIALAAATSPYVDGAYQIQANQGNLRARGYKVRIGYGTYIANTDSSNAWGADIHIPIHSNARTEACTNTTASGHGTWVMYTSTSGGELSTSLKSTVGASSPGTADRICTDSVCFGGSLYELRHTTAVAAYLETDFHTWNSGVSWLNSAHTRWAWRIGSAVDSWLGYP